MKCMPEVPLHKEIVAFMDGTDFLYEEGQPIDGNRFYASVSGVKNNHKCWKECGIAKLEIKLVGWVTPPRPDLQMQNAVSAKDIEAAEKLAKKQSVSRKKELESVRKSWRKSSRKS